MQETTIELPHRNYQIILLTMLVKEETRIHESERLRREKLGDKIVGNTVSLELESARRCCKQPACCPFSYALSRSDRYIVLSAGRLNFPRYCRPLSRKYFAVFHQVCTAFAAWFDFLAETRRIWLLHRVSTMETLVSPRTRFISLPATRLRMWYNVVYHCVYCL